MAGSRTLKLNILAETKDLVAGLNKAQSATQQSSSRIDDAFKKVGAAVAAAGAAAGAFAIKFGVEAVKAASNLSETISKVNVLFGDSATKVQQFAESAAKNFGQSQQQALDAAATFATFGAAAGLAGDDLVKFSTDFTGLASDLASFNNTSPEQAINAIGAALRGEAEPLRQYGVLLNDATLKQAALELGIISTTNQALTPQQKVLAAQKVIYEQTTAAQGDFARTSDGLANQQRILAAEFENVKTKIGSALLPVVNDLFQAFAKRAIPAAEEFARIFEKQIVPYMENRVVPALQNLGIAINQVGTAFEGTTKDVKESNFFIETLKETIVNFVPVTLEALATVAAAWGTLVDVLRRGVAFIQGDLTTATREWENRFAALDKEVNNVNDSMVRAYEQFDFYNKQTKNETIPGIGNLSETKKDLDTVTKTLTDSTTKATAATKGFTAASKESTAALKEEFTALQALDLLRAGFGSQIGTVQPGSANIPGQLPGGETFRSAAELIGQFGGKIKGFNADPGDPFYGFTKGDTLAGFKPGQAGNTNITINVTGTVVDPEGTARAVASVLQGSSSRAGNLILTPVLGVA